MQDAVEVFEQIKRAVRTLRKLPPVTVKSRFCNWPDIVRSFYEVWREGETTPPKIGITAKQITEMDQVIAWLAWLSQHPGFGPDYTRIMWARAENVPWKRIAKLVGKSPRTCQEWFRVGVFGLAYALDQRMVK
jgi:hypothetical protein